MHSMLAHWVPPLERSKFAAIVYAGNYIFSIFLNISLNISIFSFFNQYKSLVQIYTYLLDRSPLDIFTRSYIHIFTYIHDIFLRCKLRHCRVATGERLAVFLRIMGWLASRILFVRWTRYLVVCILVDIHIRYSGTARKDRSF